MSVDVDEAVRQAARQPRTHEPLSLQQAYEDLEQERYLREWRERRGLRRRPLNRLAARVGEAFGRTH